MLTLKTSRVKFSNLFWFLIFYILLFFCFDLVVIHEHAFIKSKLPYEIDRTNLIIGAICIVFHTYILTFSNLKDFHYAISALILIFFVFPSAIIFSYLKDFDGRIFLSRNLLFLIVLLMGKVKIKIKSKKIAVVQSKKLLLFIVIIGLIPFVIIFLPYLNLNNLLLEDIYETREFMSLTIGNLYTDYSHSWFSKFIIPCLLVFGIYFKDRLTVVIGSAALIFLYLCGANKVVFGALVMTFLLYKYDYLKKINFLLKVLIGIGAFSLIVALALDYDALMTISMRRAFLLPAMVDVFYFDMFDNDPLLWSGTFNGLFRNYPFDLVHSYVIGEKYFDNVKWNANNGIISEGFMNAGMIGVLINITIIAIYFSLLNQLNISHRFFGLFLILVFAILSSALTTVMLSHGGMVLLLLAFFFMRNTDRQMP